MSYDQPHLQIIEEMSTISSHMEGIRYFHEGRVGQLHIDDDVVTAKVTDTKVYSVSIVKNYKKSILHCTCPYDRDGFCKHIVAVLFSVYDRTGNVDIINDVDLDYKYAPRGGHGSSARDYGMPYDDPSAVLEFVRNALQGIGTGRGVMPKGWDVKRPPAAVNDKTPPSRKCRQHMKRLYEGAKGKNGRITSKNRVSFDSIENMATSYNDCGHPEKAIEVYRHMCEYISENIDVVDNMKHYYTGQVRRSMLDAVTLIRRLKLDHDKKRDHILYFFERHMQEKVGHFAPIYLGALLNMLDGIEDARYCKSLFESQILGGKPVVAPDRLQRDQTEILEAASSVLERMEGGSDDMMDFLSDHHEQSESLCTKYIWNLMESDADEALRIAHKASKMFKNPEQFARIRSFILEQKGDPNQVGALRDMFIATSNWTYYEKIKDIADDWESQLGMILADLRSYGHIHTCIDVLLHEKKADDAVKAALESCNLDLLDAYSGEFSRKYPNQYYEKYAEQLPMLVKSAMTIHDYDAIKRHIRIMKNIPNHVTKSRELVSDLEAKYPQLAEQMES